MRTRATRQAGRKECAPKHLFLGPARAGARLWPQPLWFFQGVAAAMGPWWAGVNFPVA